MFGSNTNVFGQQQPAFGAQQATPFGAMATQAQPQQTNLFGNSMPSLFGSTGGLNQTNSLFGSTNPAQPSTFGAQPSTFGAPTAGTSGASLFGNATQPQSSLFGSTTNRFGMASTSAFSGAVGQPITGTPVKFTPPVTSDTMIKSGQTHNTTISIHLQCITCMREYETKSLEELRLEDYNVNRKGPQQQQQQQQLFGSTSLGSTAAGGGLFPSSTTNTFGSSAPSTGLFNNQNKLGFASTSTTTTTPSLFGPSKPSFFNSNPTNTTFQAQPQQGLFGSAPAAQPLGTSLFNTNPTGLDQSKSFFGGAATQQSSLFNNQNKPMFGASTVTPFGQPQTSTATSFGGFSSTANTGGSLFGSTATQPTFGLNNAAATNNTALGGNKAVFPFNTGATSAFGTSTSSSNLFGSTNTFGTNTAGTGLFNTGGNTNTFSFNPTGTSTFGAAAAPAFGNSTFGASTFGGTGGLGGGGASLFSNNVNSQAGTLPAAAPSINADQILTRLQTFPYGNALQFNGDSSYSASAKTKFTTDPKTLNKYKIDAKSQAEVKVQRVPAGAKPTTLLFDGLDDEGADSLKCAQDIFQPKSSIKKLVLNKTKNVEGASPFASSITTTITPILTSRVVDLNGPSPAKDSTPRESAIIADDTISAFNHHHASASKKEKPQLSQSRDEESSLSYTFDQTIHTNSIEAEPVISHSVPKCGIILTRADYYIIPSIEECDALYDVHSDTCIVDGFTVGRVDYGSIYWKGPLNVKGLNLDEFVHIRRKEVIVYPDDESKPAMGQGLNRPAQVTLDQVWPVDKTTREFIKDPEKLRAMKYAEKVENATIKLGATFKDYRIDTGSWVFTVKHFSKYGLNDDDDEDENVQPRKPAQPAVPLKKEAAAVPPRGLFAPDHNVLQFREKDVHFPPSKVLADWHQEKLDSQDYESMSEESGNYENEPMDLKHKSEINAMRSALFDEDDDDHDHEMKEEQDSFDCKRQAPKVTGIKRSKTWSASKNNASSFQIMPSLFAKKLKPVVVPQKRQLNLRAIMSKNKADIYSMCYARAPRVNFVKGSTRFCLHFYSNVLIFELDMLQMHKNDSIQKLEAHLEKNSVVKNVEAKLPLMIETSKYALNAKMSSSLNSLITALYGELVETSNYARYQERVRKILNWLFIFNKTLPVPDNSVLRIIHFLTTNELEFAITTCLNTKQPRLAFLLSYANKLSLIAQLDSWKQSQADQFIEKDLLKLYVLLSGQAKWKISSGETISVYEGLEWTQQLALILLFKNRNDQQAEDIIGSNVVKSAMLELLHTPNVVEYHLLAQHSPWLAIAACPDHIDSWLILQALLAFNVIINDVHVNRSDSINLFLASQVKELKWSLYFVLHIKDDHLRYRSVREILSSHALDVGDNNLASFLSKTFSSNFIPQD